MCSCCACPHENGLVGFYSLQTLFKLCFFVSNRYFECAGAKSRYIPTYTGWRYIASRHIRTVNNHITGDYLLPVFSV